MVYPAMLLVAELLVAGSPDTLQTATVVSDHGVTISKADTLKVSQSQTVTELFLQMPGAYVGDNGGYAGLKSISLRGMGSPHTTIYVDGVRMGNVQNGQGDLGALGLANFSTSIVDYARNRVSFITAKPSFTGGRKVGGNVKLQVGSFGTWLPSARLDWKISDKITLSANADGVISKGDFSYGNGQVRENNDIAEIRGGLDLFGTIADGDWHIKTWYNGSDRGTPGSVSWPSDDRQSDRNVFVQCLFRKQVTARYHLTASAKTAYDKIYYTSSWGDSRYDQLEAQLNSFHKLSILKWLDISFTADVSWDGLNSTSYTQQRWATTEAVAATFHIENFKADIGLQYDGVFDRDQHGRNCLSPSLDLKYTTAAGFSISGFVRRAYRVPTFNELYYVGYGNPDLKPEDALMTDLGADWAQKMGSWILKAKVDGFCNILKDKIASAPSSEDPNVWRPYNIGRVRSAGADIMAGFDFSDKLWRASFSVRYGFQDAVDKTPDSSTYDQQINFIARHSLSMNASGGIRGWQVLAAWNLRAGRRDSSGEMPDWNTLDLNLSKSFDLGKRGTPLLKLSFKNITDNRYELTSGYPMPGFSVTGGVEYRF